MLAASLAADVPLFIASPTSDWARAGASFVPSPVIATRWPSACSLRMKAIFVLGRGLGDEVVDARLPGDRRRRAWVVAGDHHRPDAHPAELGEALDEPLLDRVLELDHAEHATVDSGWPAGSPPRSAITVGRGQRARPASPPSRSAAMASTAPLRISRRRRSSARRCVRVSAVNGISSAMVAVESAEAGLRRSVPPGCAELGEPLSGELDDRAPLGRLVADRGDEGGRHGLGLGHARSRRDRRGQPVAVGDRARSCRAG